MSDNVGQLLAAMSANQAKSEPEREPRTRVDDGPSFAQQIRETQAGRERPQEAEKSQPAGASAKTDDAQPTKDAKADDAKKTKKSSDNAEPKQTDDVPKDGKDGEAQAATAANGKGVTVAQLADGGKSSEVGKEHAGKKTAAEPVDVTSKKGVATKKPVLTTGAKTTTQESPQELTKTEQGAKTSAPPEPKDVGPVKLDPEIVKAGETATKELPEKFEKFVKSAIKTAKKNDSSTGTVEAKAATAKTLTDKQAVQPTAKTAEGDVKTEKTAGKLPVEDTEQAGKLAEKSTKVKAQTATATKPTEQPTGEARQTVQTQMTTAGASVVQAGPVQPQGQGRGSAQLPAIESIEGASSVLKARGATATDAMSRLARQTVASIRMGRNDATVQMHPPELGSVRVRLSSGEGNVMEVRMAAEQEGTRQLIQRHIEDLRSGLERDGINVGKFDVSTQGNHQRHEAFGRPGWGSRAGSGVDGFGSGPDRSGSESTGTAATAAPVMVGLLNFVA